MLWTRREMLKATAMGLVGSTMVGFTDAAEPQRGQSGEKLDHPVLKNLPTIDESDYAARIAQAQKLMGENKIDALYLTGGTSMRYFTGINWGRSERVFALIIPKSGEIKVICPGFEEERARERVGEHREIRVWQEHESPYDLAKGIFADFGFTTGNVGIEETTRFFEVNGLTNAIPNVNFVSGDPITHGCRSIKTEKELALMQAANIITVDVYAAVLGNLKEGMMENATGAAIRAEFRKYGLSGGASVLHGENSAYPHGTANRQALKEGMVVLADGGCRIQGYGSDITRTVVFGKPSRKQKKVWNTVRKAQDAALKAAKVGAPCGNVDDAARAVVEKAGFGPQYKYFGHRLGHGIGMDGHEWPYLVKGNKQTLQPGMTFSNEPGIYIYGEFGIRLEDIMVINKDGGKLFTQQSKSLAEPFG